MVTLYQRESAGSPTCPERHMEPAPGASAQGCHPEQRQSLVPRCVPEFMSLLLRASQKHWVEDALQKQVGTELGDESTSVMIKWEVGELPKRLCTLGSVKVKTPYWILKVL